jgi:hypothetical protein
MKIDPKRERLRPVLYWNMRVKDIAVDEGKLNYFVVLINEPRQIEEVKERLKIGFRSFGSVEEWKEYDRKHITSTDYSYQLVTFSSIRAPEGMNLFKSKKGEVRKNDNLYQRVDKTGLEDYVDNFVSQMKR